MTLLYVQVPAWNDEVLRGRLMPGDDLEILRILRMGGNVFIRSHDYELPWPRIKPDGANSS